MKSVASVKRVPTTTSDSRLLDLKTAEIRGVLSYRPPRIIEIFLRPLLKR